MVYVYYYNNTENWNVYIFEINAAKPHAIQIFTPTDFTASTFFNILVSPLQSTW